MVVKIFFFLSFSSWLLNSGVATANHPPPSYLSTPSDPLPSHQLRSTPSINLLSLSRFLWTCRQPRCFPLQRPPAHTFTISPLYLTKKPSRLAFISKAWNTRRPSDVVTPDPIHPSGSQREAQHFNLGYLQLSLLSFFSKSCPNASSSGDVLDAIRGECFKAGTTRRPITLLLIERGLKWSQWHRH